MAKEVEAVPWLTNEVNPYELSVVWQIQTIAEQDVSLARHIVRLPWVGESADSLNNPESWAIATISEILGADTALAHRIAGLQWFTDGITRSERGTLEFIRRLVEDDLPTAKSIANMAFSENYGGLYHDLWSSLDGMRRKDRSLYEQFTGSPWFQDGLMAGEAALIPVQLDILRAREKYPSQNPPLNINVDISHMRSETFSSSSRDVNLILICRPSLAYADRRVFQFLRTGIEALEDYMGRPLESSAVVLHVEPELPRQPSYGGLHYYSYIGAYDLSEEPLLKRTIYHELGHFYFAGHGDWLDEGAPEFLVAYILHISKGVSLHDRNDRLQEELASACFLNGVHTILDLFYVQPELLGLARPCHYPLGESFLLGMYHGLGHDVVSASLRELSRDGGTRETREDRIYNVFQSNTPSENQAKFKELYARLHGLPPPGWKPSGPVPSTPDAKALMALYDATDGPNWTGTHYWGSEVPIGQWRGVTTDSNGRVVELRLADSQLTGPIPPELGSLSELKLLYLSENNLTGPIPPQLGKLVKLTYLFLGGNELSGPIPPQLGKLGNLVKLINLSLEKNQLSGQIPAELGNLANFQVLTLHDNRLTGCIPDSLRHIKYNDFDKLGLPFC